MASGAGCRWHTISAGIGSIGGRVRGFFAPLTGGGSSLSVRFTRSCDSCVRFIGDFQAAVADEMFAQQEVNPVILPSFSTRVYLLIKCITRL